MARTITRAAIFRIFFIFINVLMILILLFITLSASMGLTETALRAGIKPASAPETTRMDSAVTATGNQLPDERTFRYWRPDYPAES